MSRLQPRELPTLPRVSCNLPQGLYEDYGRCGDCTDRDLAKRIVDDGGAELALEQGSDAVQLDRREGDLTALRIAQHGNAVWINKRRRAK